MPVLSRNRDLVLRALRGKGAGLTSSELASRTGLSRPTVTTVLSALRSTGHVKLVDGVRTPGTRGPVPRRVVLARSAGLYVGIDCGRRHVTVAAGDSAGALVVLPQTFPVRVDQLGLDALPIVADLVRRVLRKHGLADPIRRVVLGVPAPVTPDGRIAAAGYLESWADVAIGQELSQQLAETFGWAAGPTVDVENDANLGALGEARYGVAQGSRDVVYVKASTGLSAGLLANQTLWHGHHRLAGEFGHTLVSSAAQQAVESVRSTLVTRASACARCGRSDCVENLASGEAIAALVRQAGGPAHSDVTTFEEVLARALRSPRQHTVCWAAIVSAGHRIGYALADLARVLDPEVIVFGGRLAEARPIIEAPLREALKRATMGTAPFELRFVPTKRITHSEAVGAVALALGDTRA